MSDLNTDQVSERVGADVYTVIRWIKAGAFPNAYKLNPHGKQRSPWFVPEEDVSAFLARRQKQTRDLRKS